jgi:hypothetical protein
MATRIPIRFDRFFAGMMTVLAMPPRSAYVELDALDVTVRMAWGFRATFPRSAVASARPYTGTTISRGVHGFAGRWLVNGSGQGLVSIELSPEQRGRVLGVPVKLRELTVSVDDVQGLIDHLVAT